MEGDDRKRHCATCDKDVYNISAMTQTEAEQFLAVQTVKPCVRYFTRADGTILLNEDCPVGVKRRRLKVLGAATAAVSMTCAAIAAFKGRDFEAPHADQKMRARDSLTLTSGNAQLRGKLEAVTPLEPSEPNKRAVVRQHTARKAPDATMGVMLGAL
jgi:hypothetical protein